MTHSNEFLLEVLYPAQQVALAVTAQTRIRKAPLRISTGTPNILIEVSVIFLSPPRSYSAYIWPRPLPSTAFLILAVLPHDAIHGVLGGKVNILGSHSTGHSKKKVYMTRVLFRTVFDIWRAIFSFPSTVIRHCLKHVNRREALGSYCDCP
jgi:hypothetical protein